MGPLLLMALGCAPEAPLPAVFSVVPAQGWSGEDTDVVIRGEHLLPVVTLGAEQPVGGEFEALLVGEGGSISLGGVTRISTAELAAEVPADLEPGLYDIVVRTPAGHEAQLNDAFRVTRTRADHLAFVASEAAWDLGEYATIELSVLAPDDSAVATDLTVEVVASSPNNAEGVEFAAGQLVEQTSLAGEVGIRGTLGPSGSSTLLVRSTLADDVLLTARAVNDEGVTDATLLLSWQAGALASMELTLPFSPFRAEANVPFVVHLALRDAFGNPLPDTAARVSVSDDCSSFRKVVDLVGEADIEVSLDTACEANRITVFNTSGEVESELFQVLPGEMVGYELTAAPSTSILAGTDPILVRVEAVDAWGNLVSDRAGPLTLTDTLGGLDARSGCPDLAEGTALCTAWLWRAGIDNFVATDSEGKTGTSNAVEVVADVPTVLMIDVAANETVAGNEIGVSVAVYDSFGNLVEIEPGGVDPVDFFDDTGTIDCSWSGGIGDGRHAFLCTITGATEADVVGASMPRLGLSGTASDPVIVHNAALTNVSVAAPGAVVAGSTFALTLQGFDTYGNAYTRQTDPVVDLDDTTGTLLPASATLGATGEATVTASITGADEAVRVRARQFGVLLGTSVPISVSAGAPAAFSVHTPVWVGVGEELAVAVAAVDAWGNRVSSYSGSPSLRVTADACMAASAEAFDEGVSTTLLACTTVGTGARVSASDGTFSGQSQIVDIVDFTCAAPPQAFLLLEGDTDPAVCLALDEATVSADAAGSVAGSAALVLYVIVDDEDTRARTTTGLADFIWAGAGPRYVQALVVGGDGCGAETDGWAWLGEDDGEPTGPVELSVSASEVATGGSVTVSVLARDCTGDLAVGQELLVRADLGEVAGTRTGAGLSLTLDATGEGSLSWTFPAGFAKIASVYAGSSSAGAFGTATVEVTQDSERPHVLSVQPAGAWSAAVDEVVITFDEPMLAGTISAVTLTGPSGAITVTASLDGNVLTLVPTSPIDVSMGAFVVDLPSSLRDEAGNRLDGDWSGGAAAAAATFGNVANTLPATAGCTLSAAAFVPDGDDGAATEADRVSFTPLSASSPSWWELQVLEASGASVRTLRTDGVSLSLAWDGRADGGAVAAAGTYQAALYVIDAADNRASVCVKSIELNQRLELP